MKIKYEDLTPYQKNKHSKGLCSEPYCTKKHERKRWICRNHRNDLYKKNNPEQYAYNTFRNNARRRGKDFTITLEQFIEFATIKTCYMTDRGHTKNGLHIDRIDETRGYHIDNIQVLTNSQNVRKYKDFKYAVHDDVPF